MGEYDSKRVPLNSCAGLGDARAAQLLEPLLAAKQALAAGHHQAVLLIPLVRAGWTPDADTLQKGFQARQREDDEMSELFDKLDLTEPEPTAVRHWIARRIAQAVDGNGPLWPTDVPLETANVGWQRFFDIAWPLWERAAVLDRLHTRLVQKALVGPPLPGQPVSADALFAIRVLFQDLLRNDPHGEALGRELETIPYGEQTLDQVRKLAVLSRVQFGWALMKEQRYAEARRVAEAVLAEAPTDGQAHFFRARIAWLEKNDPRAAIPLVDAGLEQAANDAGRGRLLNLRGAVHDALGEYAASILWFQKALLVAEDTRELKMTTDVLSNLAEAHWKLGDKPKARQFAETASRRGSTTAIVKTILAEPAELE